MVKVIKTAEEHEQALQRIYTLMQKQIVPESKQENELELLSILVKNYEEEHYTMPAPHPLEAIKFRLEQSNTNERELNKILGGRSRKSEILSGKRKLSLAMIRALHSELNIPAESLIGSY